MSLSRKFILFFCFANLALFFDHLAGEAEQERKKAERSKNKKSWKAMGENSNVYQGHFYEISSGGLRRDTLQKKNMKREIILNY